MIKQIIKSVKEKNNQGKFLTRTYFVCSCGKKHSAWQKDITYGSVKSCGCLVATNHFKSHNMSKTKTYRAWINMKKRCNDVKAPYYKNYGGRGISYVKKWEKFENFYKDMGECPNKKSLDRIDTNKNYSKQNCRWVTQREQMNNIRRNVLYTYGNLTLTLAEFSRLYNINRKTLWIRIKRGASIKEAIEKSYGKSRK